MATRDVRSPTSSPSNEQRRRASTFFAHAGINLEQVMTDNGPAYRSHAYNAALGTTAAASPTLTNGKIGRFNRTLAAERAYVTTYGSDDVRSATYSAYLHHYKHRRPHTGTGGSTPAEHVHKRTGNYS